MSSPSQDIDEWNYDTDEIRAIDSDELYETRPNRWRGPRSTWRNLTEEDRLLHTSMVQLRNQDLSIHLYNAATLRRQPGDWRPPTKWTAWPLHVSHVPNEDLLRETHDEHDQFTTRFKEGPVPPSRKLEEEVTASILRTARTRFQERELEPPANEEDAPGAQPLDNQTSMVASELDSQPASDSESDEGSDRGTPLRVKRDPGTPYEPDQEGEERGTQTPCSQSGSEAVDDEYRPVVAADDELSYDLLRPSVRHILSQLDATLCTLHNARLAGMTARDKDEDSGTDASSIASEPTTRRRTTKPRTKSRATKARNPDYPGGTSGEEGADDGSTAAEDEEEGSPVRGRSPTKRLPDQPRRQGGRKDRKHRSDKGERPGRWALRDWREVLGAAAISGFNADVVSRAAQRCADMFGESMNLMTMEEGKHGHTVTLCQPGTQPADQVDGESSDEERNVQEARRRKRLRAIVERRLRERRTMLAAASGTRSVPISDDEGFKTAEEALSRSHSRDPSQGPLESHSQDEVRTQVDADINRVEAAPDGLFYCPVTHCKRHQKGFPLKRGLREHFRLTHDQPTAEKGEFYCPFVSCKYHTKSFKTRKNLKAHVKNMHQGELPAAAAPAGDAMDVDVAPTPNKGKGKVVEADASLAAAMGIGSEDEMEAGVHVDGFLRPIKIRQGWLSKGGRKGGQRNKKSKGIS